MSEGPADREPRAPDLGAPLADLKKASQDLKTRIDEARKENAMPINASLGDPAVDARNADGRNDLPDDEDA